MYGVGLTGNPRRRRGDGRGGQDAKESFFPSRDPDAFIISSRDDRQQPQPLYCQPNPMDQTSFNPHSTRNNFFSRVCTTSMPSNAHRSYLSTTRPQLNTPSFFAKSHMSHPAGRNSEPHITRETFQAGDSSSLHPSATEDNNIYASHKAHRSFSRGVEDTNNRHAHDNMDGTTHGPLSPQLNSLFYTSRAGTSNSSH